MTLEKQIKNGADKLICTSGIVSKGEPCVAIAQLLLSAAILAKTIDMPVTEFEAGFNLAKSEVY